MAQKDPFAVSKIVKAFEHRNLTRTNSGLKNLPSTKDGLWKEACKLRIVQGRKMLFFREAEEFNICQRAKLLHSCYLSHKIYRSFNGASIMLLGVSGAGKSSVINHLLGEKVASVSDCQSETRYTREYVLTTNCPEYEVANLQLSIIDTPGFGDTSGIAQDACNIWSTERFLMESHCLMSCYPNVILLIVPATDSRFQGNNSMFSRALEAYKNLGVFDLNNPNVVLVITHVYSLPEKGWEDILHGKKEKYQEMLRTVLQTPIPVVLLENDVDSYNLEKVGDYTKLRDGALQPKNLFMAITDMLLENKDDLGLIVLKQFFADGGKKVFRWRAGFSVDATDSYKGELCNAEIQILNEIEQRHKSSGKLSEVESKIEAYVGEHEGSMFQTDKEAAASLCDDFQRLCLQKVDDLGIHTLGSLRCLLSQNSMNPFIIQMLKEVFQLKDGPKSFHQDIYVGKGYSIRHDAIVPTSIFVLENDVTDPEFGLSLPSGVRMTREQRSKTFMECFQSKEEYIQRRLNGLNLPFQVNPGIFKIEWKTGYGSENQHDVKGSRVRNSFLYEKRLLKLSIENVDDLRVQEAFTNGVNRLPEEFDRERNLQDFEDFFWKFGEFVVLSVFGGGTIEVKMTSVTSEWTAMDLINAGSKLSAVFSRLTCGQEIIARADSEMLEQQGINLSYLATEWQGGDHKFHAASMSETSQKDWKQWEASLVGSPAIMTKEMTLLPIYDVVRRVNEKKGDACRDALRVILGQQTVDSNQVTNGVNKDKPSSHGVPRENSMGVRRRIMMALKQRRSEGQTTTTREETAFEVQPSSSKFCWIL